MYLLYADESGSIDDPNGDFFVLAGISIFERQTHWLDPKIETVAQRFNARFASGKCEFHGSPMHSGRDGWKTAATPAERAQAVADILHLLSHSQSQIRIFASVIEKRLFADKSKIIPTAFQDIAFSFDTSLRNIYYKHNNAQRGLVLFDKSTSERMIQELSYSYKHLGSSDDKLRNFAEVPVFVDSQATRLIQMADLIAYWLYRYYQSNDNRGFNIIQPHIWRNGAEILGLHEHISDETRQRLPHADDCGFPFPAPNSI